jgi:hypothetical protein
MDKNELARNIHGILAGDLRIFASNSMATIEEMASRIYENSVKFTEFQLSFQRKLINDQANEIKRLKRKIEEIQKSKN